MDEYGTVATVDPSTPDMPTPAGDYGNSGLVFNPYMPDAAPAPAANSDMTFGQVITSAAQLFGTGVNAVTSFQNAAFNRTLQTTQMDTARYIAQSNAGIERTRADYSLLAAQQQLNTARVYGTVGGGGFSGGAGSGGNRTMLWLTIIGVALAWAEYAKP